MPVQLVTNKKLDTRLENRYKLFNDFGKIKIQCDLLIF